jgi:two-component system, OmpR family, manganese sensing sensor histidine kinase
VMLAPLLAETVEEQRTIAADKKIHLDLSLPADLAQETILADRDQIIRVCTNIIANALQYTPIDGTVKLSLNQIKRSAQSYLQIKVADTGSGIPAEAIAQVFERFYRVDPARSKSSGGTGLGLSIAKAIVDNHQGQITIESPANQGTIVTVVLPQPNLEPLA